MILGQTPVDEGRLELEVALLADKIDVTEECTRFKSHIKFFDESLHDSAESGKKLNIIRIS